jgi:O-acetyl-ADP-ribose deacetylase (regulator of RNase III)
LPRRVRIAGASLELFQGSITDIEAEALVNAANNHLWMGAGVAGVLKKVGGKEIEEEAVVLGPIPVGEAVVTSAGKLKASYVIHAAAMGVDLKPDRQSVGDATLNSLKRAYEKKMESVVFPALGTGIGHFPMSDCARIMIGTAIDFLLEHDYPRRVIFALYDEGAFQHFSQELDRLFKKH